MSTLWHAPKSLHRRSPLLDRSRLQSGGPVWKRLVSLWSFLLFAVLTLYTSGMANVKVHFSQFAAWGVCSMVTKNVHLPRLLLSDWSPNDNECVTVSRSSMKNGRDSISPRRINYILPISSATAFSSSTTCTWLSCSIASRMPCSRRAATVPCVSMRPSSMRMRWCVPGRTSSTWWVTRICGRGYRINWRKIWRRR